MTENVMKWKNSRSKARLTDAFHLLPRRWDIRFGDLWVVYEIQVDIGHAQLSRLAKGSSILFSYTEHILTFFTLSLIDSSISFS